MSRVTVPVYRPALSDSDAELVYRLQALAEFELDRVRARYHDSVLLWRLPGWITGRSACTRTVASTGTITLDSVFYKVDVHRAFEQVLIISDGKEPGDKITVTDFEGEILAEHTRPAPGIRYVGNGRRPGTRPKNTEPSPKS